MHIFLCIFEKTISFYIISLNSVAKNGYFLIWNQVQLKRGVFCYGARFPIRRTRINIESVTCPCSRSRDVDFVLERIYVNSKDTAAKDKEEVDEF